MSSAYELTVVTEVDHNEESENDDTTRNYLTVETGNDRNLEEENEVLDSDSLEMCFGYADY